MKIDLVIDFGASNLRIYKNHSGLIFSQPNKLVNKTVNKIENSYLFCRDAKEREGKLAQGEAIFSPIVLGKIMDTKAQKDILEYAFNKCGINYTKYKNIRAIIPVSCGISREDLSSYKSVLEEIGIRDYHFVMQPICVAKMLDANYPQLIVDIGYDKCEIALIYNGEITRGLRLDIGGRLLNIGAREILKAEKNILASNETIEKLKTTIGSLFSTDNSSYKILAQDKLNLIAKNYTIIAKDINPAFIECHNKIVQLLQAFLADCTPEMITGITSSGITLCGDSAKLFGIKNFYENKLHLKVKILESYGNAVVEGANTLFVDASTIQKFALN